MNTLENLQKAADLVAEAMTIVSNIAEDNGYTVNFKKTDDFTMGLAKDVAEVLDMDPSDVYAILVTAGELLTEEEEDDD